MRELPHEMAARLTQLDYEREMAFIVTTPDSLPGKSRIWGVVRCNADPDMEKAEYSILSGSKHDRSGAGADVDALYY
ncbi:MAG: hypothetical protein IPL59_17010 [Candidatus Competibacteraceae bacterium]|nr:hypothetical protein [Candidatus Competibacteraceae bacterium]